MIAGAISCAQSPPMEPSLERPLPSEPTKRQTRVHRSRLFNLLRDGETLEDLEQQGAPPPVTTYHPLPSRAELPGDLADSIFVGSITAAQAYLSDNHSSIYTEVSVRVEQVMAQSSPHLAAGGEAVLLMPGGSLKLSNGHVLRHEVYGNGGPLQLNSRYVFFCVYSENTRAFTLTKAWRLVGGHARPVAPDDLARSAQGASSYDGMNEWSFLSIVRAVTPSYRAPGTP